MTRLHPTEAQIQSALMEWAGYAMNQYPELYWLHANPNGGRRDLIEAKHLKQQGVKPGVPDLHLPVARGGFHSLYIELKSRYGRISDAQYTWILGLRAHGNRVVVCYSLEAAIETIESYLGEK